MAVSTHAPGKTGTKARLLDAACERIGAHGYRATTVGEICRAAGANIAAVNYHFGSKRELYRAAWAHAFARCGQRHPLPDDDLEPRPWIDGFIGRRVEAVFDDSPGGWFPRLVAREMTNPTDLADHFREEYLTPQIGMARRKVAEWLGVPPASAAAETCTLNLHGMLVHLNCVRTLGMGPLGKRRYPPRKRIALVRQMQTFVRAGLEALAATGGEGTA